MALSLKKHPMPVQAPEIRAHNFEEVALGYDEETAVAEAERCLHCKVPQCRKGCPVSVDIPAFIAKIKERDYDGAIEKIKETNSLPAVCGRVCPQENQCEKYCILGKKGEPVGIGRLERFAADRALAKEMPDAPFAAAPDAQRVAVIGSGPSGLSCAGDLAKRGYKVTIFEALHKAGGVLSYGIPEFRLPKDKVVQKEIENLEKLGVTIETDAVAGRLYTVDELLGEERFDAVFIGSGAWKARRLNVKGESLGNVAYAVDYLQNPEVYELGDRVAVIGAGNSAMDVARTAVRMGSQHVTIYCRGQKARASQRELDYTLADGVEIEYGLGVAELTPDGPLFRERTFDEEGHVTSEGEPALYPADTTIIAASQTTKSKIVNTTTGLDLNDKGLIAVHGNGETSRAGVFSGGDVVLGPWNVIQTVKNSKLVAEAMDRYLTAKRQG